MKAKRRKNKPIRVLLADDHILFCESLCQTFDLDEKIEIVFCVHDLGELPNCVKEYKPDVVLMDLSFPDCCSVDMIASLCRVKPKPSIVVLSMYTDVDAVARSRQAGALGYVAKGDDLDTLQQAIEHANAKKSYVSPQVSHAAGHDVVDFSVLSERERQIVALLLDGLNLSQAAARLQIAYKTAHMHQHAALKRVGLSSIAELLETAKLANRFTGMFRADKW